MTREHYDAQNALGVFPSATGLQINLLDPWPDSITVQDIAAGLSKVCRFGGQIKQFYSVAQHSILVSRLVPAELKLAALFHDATEAYLGDVVKPLKLLIAELYGPIERRFERVIFDRFGLELSDLELVKPYDLQAYAVEEPFLRRGEKFEWIKTHEILGLARCCWHPHIAEMAFLDEYKALTARGLAEFHGAD